MPPSSYINGTMKKPNMRIGTRRLTWWQKPFRSCIRALNSELVRLSKTVSTTMWIRVRLLSKKVTSQPSKPKWWNWQRARKLLFVRISARPKRLKNSKIKATNIRWNWLAIWKMEPSLYIHREISLIFAAVLTYPIPAKLKPLNCSA